MKSEEDGDALVGRTVAQLKFTADEFDVLPLHFDFDTLKHIEELGWERVLPDYALYPRRFQVEVVPKLVASLIYHYENGDLRRMYAANHPIFYQMLFIDKEVFNVISNKAILAFQHCPVVNMYATGVPSVITIGREIRELRDRFESTKDSYENRLSTLEEAVVNEIRQQPQKVVDLVLERFELSGVVPVTKDDIRNCIEEVLGVNGPIQQLLSRIETENRSTIDALTRCSLSTSRDNDNSDVNAVENDGSHHTGYVHLWSSDGRLHMVPEGFTFPSYVVGTMWNLWFFGDSSRRICSYKSLLPAIELVQSKCRTNHSRCKKVMKELIKIAIDGGVLQSVKHLQKDNQQHVFDYAYQVLLKRLYPKHDDHGPPRPASININTIANKMKS